MSTTSEDKLRAEVEALKSRLRTIEPTLKGISQKVQISKQGKLNFSLSLGIGMKSYSG
jgi:hypothetical protein